MVGLFFFVSSVSFQALFISLHLLIIILFQEDNIFGTNASLTYVFRYKDIQAFDNNKSMKIIYSMYRAGEVSVHRACCERATQPYSLGGGGYDLSRLKTSRCCHTLSENGNRVFTHSLDVN